MLFNKIPEKEVKKRKVRIIHVLVEYDNGETKKANFRIIKDAISWLNLIF